MNSSSKDSSLDGQESVSGLNHEHISGAERKSADTADNMKRAATQLIQQYYYQLTKGCGNKDCCNINCASSPSFHFANIDCNKLAVEAVALFKSKAPLCDRSPSKLCKVSIEQEEDGPSTSSECQKTNGGQGAKSKVSASSSSLSDSPCGSSSTAKEEAYKYFTEEILNDLISECEESKSWSKLIRAIGSVFSKPESIALSFQKVPNAPSSLSTHVSESAASYLQSDSSSTISSVGSSVDPEPLPPSPTLLMVDLPSLRKSYQRLMSIPDQPFQGALINALISLSQTLELQLKYPRSTNKTDYLNIFIIIMENPLLHSPEFLDSAFPCVCRAVSALPISEQAKLVKIWAEYSKEDMLSLVQALQQMITVRVINNEGRWSSESSLCDDFGITSATCVLKILYYASLMAGGVDSSEILQREKERNDAESIVEHMQGAFGFEPKDSSPPKEDPLGKECGIRVIDCRKPFISFEDFINEPLNDNLDIELDYINYRADSKNKFSFVPYNFILTTASKHNSMYYDNRIRMIQERRTAFFMQTLVHGGPPNPFLRVRVRRDHIIDDALVNLELIAMENPSDLRKQLFVEFEGEQGLDEGGVSKEFFQLIVEELFNPDIGMFIYNEVSHHFWFSSQSFENDAQFTLIGILLGLAIYNSCILDIHFPMVVYRKLLGKVGTFQDLMDVDPTLINSLQYMLDYDGDDFEDIFEQTFCIGYEDVFGTSLTHNLKEDGDKITVTQENKQEFVDLYADYLLNKSIERQFRAFKRGFLMVTSESPLRMLFRADELEMLVCGSKVFDFHALEGATEYDGGFTSDSPTIRNFWLVVHEMNEADKRKLLQFTTGTDRVPVGGLSKLKMIIARNGPDSDRLPTSHTCFNVLLLPEYPTVEKMQDRLTKAINYSKGFGML